MLVIQESGEGEVVNGNEAWRGGVDRVLGSPLGNSGHTGSNQSSDIADFCKLTKL